MSEAGVSDGEEENDSDGDKGEGEDGGSRREERASGDCRFIAKEAEAETAAEAGAEIGAEIGAEMVGGGEEGLHSL